MHGEIIYRKNEKRDICNAVFLNGKCRLKEIEAESVDNSLSDGYRRNN